MNKPIANAPSTASGARSWRHALAAAFTILTSTALANFPADSRGQPASDPTTAHDVVLSDTTADYNVLEEVVVTAQKRSETLLNVPISMAVLNNSQLQSLQITSIDQLEFNVPGLSIQSNGGDTRRVAIRGISNASGNFALIGMYLNEADVTMNSYSLLDLSTYDLARVEVLRGPQGTLYGEGSAGGTLRFITNEPNLHKVESSVDGTVMFTQDGAPSQQVTAMVNAPVAAGSLGLRLAGSFDHEGGWIDQPAADRTNINAQNMSDARLEGLWTPVEHFSASGLVQIHRNDEGGENSEDPHGNFTQVLGLTTTPKTLDEFDIYNLTLKYAIPGVNLLTTGTYVKQYQDVRNYGFSVQQFAPPRPPLDLLESPIFINSHSLPIELRATSAGTGPWKWTIGGFYKDYVFDLQEAAKDGFPIPGSPIASVSLSTGLSSKAWSAYGDTSYLIADRLTLGAGVRYFRDKEQQISAPPPAVQSGSFSSVDPRFYAQYKLTPSWNVYGSAAKGFRSGGFNVLGQPSYGPEDVWTYELGTKVALRPAHLSGDADVYYSDYRNYIITGVLAPPNPPLAILRNAGDALVRGVEWDIAWDPVENWILEINGDVLKTRFYRLAVLKSGVNIGDPIGGAPNYTVSGAIQRDIIMRGRPASLRVEYSQQDRVTAINRNLGPWAYAQSPIIRMLNFDADIQLQQDLRVEFFATNLLNDRGLIFPSNADAAHDIGERPRPRTYGVAFHAYLH